MNLPVIIFLSVAGSLFLGFLIIVVMAIIQTKRLSRMAANLPSRPRPPFRCPACKGEQIEILSSGLWSGEDAAGKSTGGGFEYGLCKQCGGRCCRYVDDHPFIPTDEQWQSQVGSREKWACRGLHAKLERRAKNWPFDSESEKPTV